jgi:hypothetical protein
MVRSERADALHRQKMKVDYLQSLCNDSTVDAMEQQQYIVELREARQKYLDLLS